MRGGRPVDGAAGVPGPVGTDPAGLAGTGRDPERGVTDRAVGPGRQATGIAEPRGHVQRPGQATLTSRAHHSRPKGAHEATSTTTWLDHPASGRDQRSRRRGATRGPGPSARAVGPAGRRGRMRMGPLASMVADHRPPGPAVGGTVGTGDPAIRAGSAGASSPMMSTAASRAPMACTQPEPLEWATPAQAATATALPTTGANQATGRRRVRTRTAPGESGSRLASRRANRPQETRARPGWPPARRRPRPPRRRARRRPGSGRRRTGRPPARSRSHRACATGADGGRCPGALTWGGRVSLR